MEIVSLNDAMQSTSSVLGGTSAKTGRTEYQSNDFMQMLLAQLSNQNPLEPLKDSEMMSQFTQLNSLQQLEQIQSAITQMVKENQSTYAASLIGRTVSINQAGGNPVEGKVVGFSLENGKAYVQVGEKSYSLDDVLSVKEGSING